MIVSKYSLMIAFSPEGAIVTIGFWDLDVDPASPVLLVQVVCYLEAYWAPNFMIRTDEDQLEQKIRELHQASMAVGLEINLDKTKVLSHSRIAMTVNSFVLEVVERYVYLGHTIMLGAENQTAQISRRIGLSWAAFGKLGHILKDIYIPNIPISLKRKVYNVCILPVTINGLETATITKGSANRLPVLQRAMERRVLNVRLRDKITNQEIRRRTRIKDAGKQISRNKWRWAGHVARDDVKWTKKVMQWRPRQSKRSVGRPIGQEGQMA
ncbi:hypothetical protein HUJ04_007048 [Dendroctonus ponderosae]|nr:hypothetical protein HUJ04_007048 [Dendroctonus ponderosae]